LQFARSFALPSLACPACRAYRDPGGNCPVLRRWWGALIRKTWPTRCGRVRRWGDGSSGTGSPGQLARERRHTLLASGTRGRLEHRPCCGSIQRRRSPCPRSGGWRHRRRQRVSMPPARLFCEWDRAHAQSRRRHALMARGTPPAPTAITEQAPQPPSPQATLVPVRPTTRQVVGKQRRGRWVNEEAEPRSSRTQPRTHAQPQGAATGAG